MVRARWEMMVNTSTQEGHSKSWKTFMILQILKLEVVKVLEVRNSQAFGDKIAFG